MEYIPLFLLAGICLWLLWKLNSIRRGISSLSDALGSETLPDRDGLDPATQKGKLSLLCDTAFARISDAELQKDVQKARRKILDYVTNQIDDALFIVDGTLEVRFSNKASRRLFPQHKSHAGSQLIEICFDHRIVETVSEALRTKTKMRNQIETANPARNLLIEAAPFGETGSAEPEAWVLIRDVTAQLQTEQIRKDFVANASHELRTPLSIISGHLEILGDEVDSTTIELLKKHTGRITRIVEDMLTISKLENGANQGLLNKEAFDLSSCANGIVEQLQPLISRGGAEVRVKVPDKSPPRFYGDRFYFDQIFFNLIENALKQNPGPGLKVTVQISGEEEGGRMTIKVIDNGVGIPAADLSEIFNRFYRVDKHHSQATKGTGLGLSIVKRAVEAHNGLISVTSQPGARTCFKISLPADPAGSDG